MLPLERFKDIRSYISHVTLCFIQLWTSSVTTSHCVCGLDVFSELRFDMLTGLGAWQVQSQTCRHGDLEDICQIKSLIITSFTDGHLIQSLL